MGLRGNGNPPNAGEWSGTWKTDSSRHRSQRVVPRRANVPRHCSILLGLRRPYTLCVSRLESDLMNKTLIKHGNSLALVIDKPILEMLQITAETVLELSTNGDAILIRPIRDKRRQRKLEAALESINQKFGDDLERLAQ